MSTFSRRIVVVRTLQRLGSIKLLKELLQDKKFSVTERICLKNKCTIHSSAKAKSKNNERNGMSFLQVDQELLKQVQDDVKNEFHSDICRKEKIDYYQNVHFLLSPQKPIYST
jgi:hypothetical protein